MEKSRRGSDDDETALLLPSKPAAPSPRARTTKERGSILDEEEDINEEYSSKMKSLVGKVIAVKVLILIVVACAVSANVAANNGEWSPEAGSAMGKLKKLA